MKLARVLTITCLLLASTTLVAQETSHEHVKHNYGQKAVRYGKARDLKVDISPKLKSHDVKKVDRTIPVKSKRKMMCGPNKGKHNEKVMRKRPCKKVDKFQPKHHKATQMIEMK